MTKDMAVPTGHSVYTWDAPHACGITGYRNRAINEAHNAVTDAEIGTLAVVRGGPLSGYLPNFTIGYAERTKNGVRWIQGPPTPAA